MDTTLAKSIKTYFDINAFTVDDEDLANSLAQCIWDNTMTALAYKTERNLSFLHGYLAGIWNSHRYTGGSILDYVDRVKKDTPEAFEEWLIAKSGAIVIDSAEVLAFYLETDLPHLAQYVHDNTDSAAILEYDEDGITAHAPVDGSSADLRFSLRFPFTLERYEEELRNLECRFAVEWDKTHPPYDPQNAPEPVAPPEQEPEQESEPEEPSAGNAGDEEERIKAEREAKERGMLDVAKSLAKLVNDQLPEGEIYIEIEYRRETSESVNEYTDWTRSYFEIFPGQEYFYVRRKFGPLLYAVNVSADSVLTAASELMQLLAAKF